MAKAEILIAEDDGVVAKDIQNRLKNLGFRAPTMVPSGEEAIKKVKGHKPDLVLMDIMLKGEVNGTETAEQIRSQFDIPVVYLTAYADEKVLERAKVTEPFGYIIKPFEDRELNAAIEIALYKHKMEKKLRESEEWLSTTLNSIGDAVIATDKEGHVTFMNPVTESLTGWHQEEAKGKPLQDVFNIINEETREKVENPVAKVLREGTVVGLANHAVLITKDGTEILIDDSGSPIRDEKGDITGVVLVFRDVREKREAEEALRESEEKYRTILESIEESYFEVDITGNFTFFNDSLSKTLGYSNDELMGMNNRDYMSPESAKKIYNLFNQIYRTGNPIKKVAYEIVRKDGSHGFHELYASLLKNQAGQPIGFRGIAHDITESKKAEDALRESKENLDKAQKMAHIGNWSRDLHLNRAQWSDEMYRIFGLTPGDPAEISFELFLSRVHPEDRERVTSVLKEAAEKKQAFDFEFRTIPIEGSERIIRVRGEVEYDETGAPVRLFGTDQDITETRRLEDQLQKARKMEAMGLMAGGIAHDLNNILSGIVSYPELLLMDIPVDSPMRC